MAIISSSRSARASREAAWVECFKRADREDELRKELDEKVMGPFLIDRVQQLWQLSQGPLENYAKAAQTLDQEAENAVKDGIAFSRITSSLPHSRVIFLQSERQDVLIARIGALYDYFRGELRLDRDLTKFRQIPAFKDLPALHDAVEKLMHSI